MRIGTNDKIRFVADAIRAAVEIGELDLDFLGDVADAFHNAAVAVDEDGQNERAWLNADVLEYLADAIDDVVGIRARGVPPETITAAEMRRAFGTVAAPSAIAWGVSDVASEGRRRVRGVDARTIGRARAWGWVTRWVYEG